MAWSGFGQTYLVWKRAGVQESHGPVSGRTQPARYQFPHFQTRFRSSTDIPDKIVQNQPGHDLVLADCARFWQKRIQSGSKPMCKNRPARFCGSMLPSRSGPDANRIRHVYWEESSIHWAPKQHNKAAQPKADKCPTFHFPPCNCCLSVHCSLKKGGTPTFRILYFVTIYSVFNLTSYVFGSSKTRI